MGHCHHTANSGEFFTAELQGEPLLLVRAASGELRGFYNVCRHCAGRLAEGCGSRKLFRCGYDGWTYGLDGKLISSTEVEGVQDFRPEDFALKLHSISLASLGGQTAGWGAERFLLRHRMPSLSKMSCFEDYSENRPSLCGLAKSS